MKSLTEKIIKKLTNKRFTISVAESCTGGLLSSALTSVNGSSKVFKFGVVVYSNKSKIKILYISKKIIKVAKGFVITENKLGIVTANSGIDESNIKGNDLALLLPKNPNTTAKKISLKILKE